MSDKEMFIVESSPQIRDKDTTKSIMWNVSLALLPAGIWGVYIFGLRALLVVLLSIVSAMVIEYGIARLFQRNTLNDGSAFLTGLLLGYNMPPNVPLYIPIFASAVAIAIIKWTFGGLGGNWMNPALGGRVFVFFSWTSGMSAWKMPSVLNYTDGMSSATPLTAVKTGLMDFSGNVSGPASFLQGRNYLVSDFGKNLSLWFQNNLGLSVSPVNIDLFFGNIPGCIGEVSALLLLLGAAYLMYKKIISWHIPAAYFGSFIILVWIFGGLRFNNGFFTGNIWFHLFSGGMMIGVLFMATDMVTSPLTEKGMLIYGVGAGLLTFIIRFYGSLPEGVSLAIILMNIFVPMINRYTQPKVFGLSPKGGKA